MGHTAAGGEITHKAQLDVSSDANRVMIGGIAGDKRAEMRFEKLAFGARGWLHL